MYAVLVDEKQNLNWTEVPDPVAGENEVLIEIHAASWIAAMPSPLAPA